MLDCFDKIRVWFPHSNPVCEKLKRCRDFRAAMRSREARISAISEVEVWVEGGTPKLLRVAGKNSLHDGKGITCVGLDYHRTPTGACCVNGERSLPARSLEIAERIENAPIVRSDL